MKLNLEKIITNKTWISYKNSGIKIDAIPAVLGDDNLKISVYVAARILREEGRSITVKTVRMIVGGDNNEISPRVREVKSIINEEHPVKEESEIIKDLTNTIDAKNKKHYEREMDFMERDYLRQIEKIEESHEVAVNILHKKIGKFEALAANHEKKYQELLLKYDKFQELLYDQQVKQAELNHLEREVERLTLKASELSETKVRFTRMEVDHRTQLERYDDIILEQKQNLEKAWEYLESTRSENQQLKEIVAALKEEKSQVELNLAKAVSVEGIHELLTKLMGESTELSSNIKALISEVQEKNSSK